MTSKIKVDNIENQCGGAVVTKCGGTTTISGSVVKANNIQASDAGNIISQSGTTITLGASGDTISLASGASQTGFGRTGTVDWITTPKTATFSAVSGNGYFCNTSGGAFTVNLPAGSAGAIVSLADYAGTWQTSNVTVAPNGTDKIGSVNVSVNLSTEGQSVTFVFVDSTQGWINTMDSTSNVRGLPPFVEATGGTITTVCTDYKVHTFTGPGTFTVTNAGTPAGSDSVSYLVVAGGGGGGGSNNANISGGGGGGGYREGLGLNDSYTGSPLRNPTGVPVTVTGYPITVGSGGSAGPQGAGCASRGGNGANSIFSTITSTGGGGGGNGSGPVSARNGLPGGSGGGGAGGGPSAVGGSPGGTGNTPPVSPPQGRSGGTGGFFTPDQVSAGGGGATAVGGDAINGPDFSGAGGAGGTSSINGTPTAKAGGGGGAGGPGGGGGAGGAGGGGAGNPYPSVGNNSPANSGGGAGGAGNDVGGAGGSGIVIIRYKFQ